jgi:hypothetical protein
MSDEGSIYTNQAITGQTKDHSQNTELPEQLHLRIAQPKTSSDKFCTSYGHTPPMHRLGTVPDTTSRLSEHKTPPITSSEIHGGIINSGRWSHCYQHPTSPTPEPIRRSIEGTGIFRDTGIGGLNELTSSQANLTPQDELYQTQDFPHGQDTMEYSDPTTKSTSRLASKDLEEVFKDKQSEIRYHTRRSLQYPETENGATAETHAKIQDKIGQSVVTENAAATQCSQAIVGHHDPRKGEHREYNLGQLKSRSAPRPVDIECLGVTRSTPLSREQIGETARIKRPVTARPVETIPIDSTLYGQNLATLCRHEDSEESPRTCGQFISASKDHEQQSAKASNAAASDKSLSQPFPETPQVLESSKDAQISYVEIKPPSQAISPMFPPPEFARPLGGISRQEMSFPVSRNRTPDSDRARFEATHVAGLPVRGFSRGSCGQSSQPLHLSPKIGPASIYLNQIRQHFPLEEKIWENNIAHDQLAGSYRAFDPDCVAYLEEEEYEVLGGWHSQGRGYTEYLVPEDEEGFECYRETKTNDTRLWQTSAQDDDLVEGHESWKESMLGMSSASHDGQGFAETNRVEEDQYFEENQLAGEVPMGFWRLNRPF